MAWFEWISPRVLPEVWDLRRCGWHLGASGEAAVGAQLVDGTGAEPERLAPALRPRALVLALPDSAERARWLAMGYAEALPRDTGLDELMQRAARVVAPPPDTSSGPVRRRTGRLALDLVERDARVDGRRLYLHPREFALLWRLAEVPGAPVPRAALLRDVFDLGFDPGTNRLAVHVCRMRKKLATAGLPSLLATGPGDGGYRLFVADETDRDWDERGDPPQRIRLDAQFSLDRAARLGEHANTDQELVR